MKPCVACGTPIPTLDLKDGFNFVCSECECETRPQGSLEQAEKLWNEGKIYPKDESKFWEMVWKRVKQEGE